MNRTTRFELHILPMIRTIDRERMLFWKDLHAIETYYDSSGEPIMDTILKIKKHIEGGNGISVMPPVYYGGPWPEEWVALYGRWVSEGCLRLQTGKGQYDAERTDDDKVMLYGDNIQLQKGRDSFEAWFARRPCNQEEFHYDLRVEEGRGTSGEKDLEMPVSIGPEVTEIFVYDANGMNKVPIKSESGSQNA